MLYCKFYVTCDSSFSYNHHHNWNIGPWNLSRGKLANLDSDNLHDIAAKQTQKNRVFQNTTNLLKVSK